MDKMNKVLDFDPANRLITVEAGLTTSEIDLVAVEANLFTHQTQVALPSLLLAEM